VASVVLGYDLGQNWHNGARLFVESGRPLQPVCAENCPPAAGQRSVSVTPSGNLPVFWRLDARLEKKWLFTAGRWLGATLECFNVFDRREPVGDDYVPGQGVTLSYQSAIILPSVGLEGGI
jgi:hypothetical protein